MSRAARGMGGGPGVCPPRGRGKGIVCVIGLVVRGKSRVRSQLGTGRSAGSAGPAAPTGVRQVPNAGRATGGGWGGAQAKSAEDLEGAGCTTKGGRGTVRTQKEGTRRAARRQRPPRAAHGALLGGWAAGGRGAGTETVQRGCLLGRWRAAGLACRRAATARRCIAAAAQGWLSSVLTPAARSTPARWCVISFLTTGCSFPSSASLSICATVNHL